MPQNRERKDIPPDQRFILHDIPWQGYLAISDALLDRPKLRITFDRGDLELMTTSNEHEVYKKALARLIDLLAEECGIAIVTAGNMTFRREDLERGLEPDDCFWIAHEPDRRGRLTWDADQDAPPDLVLEIEVSRSVVDRLAIYATLGVPEIWTYDGETLGILRRNEQGAYHPATASLSFPQVAVPELARFVRPDPPVDSLTLTRNFRAWVRGQLSG